MPKIKTNRAAAKRFTVSGSGKIRRRRANAGHLFTKKNKKRKRRLATPTLVAPGDVKRVRCMIPYK